MSQSRILAEEDISLSTFTLTDKMSQRSVKRKRRLPPIKSAKLQSKREVWEGGHKKSITLTSSPLPHRSEKKRKKRSGTKQGFGVEDDISDFTIDFDSKEKKLSRSNQSIRNTDTISEINVEPMRLQSKPSIGSSRFFERGVSASRVSVAPSTKVLPKKMKTKAMPKLSAQARYTSKAIQTYKSDENKGDGRTEVIQYRPDIVQQNIRAVRDQLKATQNLLKRPDSDVSLISVKHLSMTTIRSKRKRHYRIKWQKGMRPTREIHKRKTTGSTASIAIVDPMEAPEEVSPKTQPSKVDISRKQSATSRSQLSIRTLVDSTPSPARSLSRFRSFVRRKRTQDYRTNLINKSLEKFKRFQVAGVRPLKITDSTQNLLNLKDKVNLENPWFSVGIEDLLDKIKLVKKYNEALKVLEMIVPYAGQEILMGYFPYPNLFLVCTTQEAKNRVITMLENDLIIALNALKTKMCRTPFRWLSFGSEDEIDSTKNLRPFYRIHVSFLYPLLYQASAKFKMRTVQDARDGYVELLCLRHTYNNIYRCLLDVATQTTLPMVSVATIIGNKVWKNRGTQYSCHDWEIHLSPQENIRLMLFLKQEYRNVEQTIVENNFMHIQTNDYQKLRSLDLKKADSSEKIAQFWEPKYCKNKTVTQVVWNPWVTGNIAVVYSETNAIVSEENYERTNVNEANYVLIWDYDKCNAADKYIYSEKVITTISFCPQDRKLIIGGTETGDILVWLLPELETKLNTPQEILTDKMYYNRNLMLEMSSWIKDLHERDIIKVKAFSSTRFGHLGQVTSLQWMLPGYKFTASGELLTVGEDEEKFLQFFSCGMDGNLFIWDVPNMVFSSASILGTKSKMKTAGRYANVLREKTLIPRYRMKVCVSNSPSCLRFIQIPNQSVKFIAVRRIATKTLFASVDDPKNKKYSVGVYLATYFGAVVHATWEKFDLILKEKYDNLEMSHLVHDGPITAFEMHPIVPEIVLSVGGKIFAVWYIPNMKRPIFWRRRPMHLLSGFWSLTNPEELTVATFDAQLETWNFFDEEKTPSRKMELTRYPIAGLFNEISTQHAHKNTLVAADYMGLVKVFSLDTPNTTRKSLSREEIVRKVQDVFDKREIIKEVWCHKPCIALAEDTGEKSRRRSSRRHTYFATRISKIIPDLKVEKKEKETQLQKIEKRREKYLQNKLEKYKETIFDSKAKQSIRSFKDLERMKENLPCLQMNQDNRRKILDEKIKKRNIVINMQVDNLLSMENTNTPKKVIDVRYRRADYATIKRQFVADYRHMEGPILKYIKWNPYDEEFNWMDYVDKRRLKTFDDVDIVSFIDTLISQTSEFDL